jgi:excinuclease ABC subunit A
VATGNTVLLIEHNPDVIINADYIIDMGPGAGKNGGSVVAEGDVSKIIICADSVTGKYLKNYMGI